MSSTGQFRQFARGFNYDRPLECPAFGQTARPPRSTVNRPLNVQSGAGQFEPVSNVNRPINVQGNSGNGREFNLNRPINVQNSVNNYASAGVSISRLKSRAIPAMRASST